MATVMSVPKEMRRLDPKVEAVAETLFRNDYHNTFGRPLPAPISYWRNARKLTKDRYRAMAAAVLKQLEQE
jgi:hypothetical protein